MLYDSHNALWVTKLRIDSVHFLTEKFPGGWYSFKFIGLLKIVSGFGEPDGKPPLQIPRNTSSGRKSTDFTNWASLGLVRPGRYDFRARSLVRWLQCEEQTSPSVTK